MCDEELYILVLRALTANPRIGEADKLRPRRLLETVSKNRPGDKAADFEFLGRDGVKRRMSHLKAEYTLLWLLRSFRDECGRVKGRLAASPAVCGMVGEGRLAVLSVNVARRQRGVARCVCPGGLDGPLRCRGAAGARGGLRPESHADALFAGSRKAGASQRHFCRAARSEARRSGLLGPHGVKPRLIYFRGGKSVPAPQNRLY